MQVWLDVHSDGTLSHLQKLEAISRDFYKGQILLNVNFDKNLNELQFMWNAE